MHTLVQVYNNNYLFLLQSCAYMCYMHVCMFSTTVINPYTKKRLTLDKYNVGKLLNSKFIGRIKTNPAFTVHAPYIVVLTAYGDHCSSGQPSTGPVST